MKPVLIILVCLVALLSSLHYSLALTIIENGRADCAIILPVKATPQEKSAARDLQRYLREISGSRVKIFSERIQTSKIGIYVGRCNAAKRLGLWDKVRRLKDDGYLLLITSDAAYLIGKDPLATRFAVFGFLEDHLGVRWYMPGDVGEVVPHSKDVALNEGTEAREPSFKMRWVGSGDWALRNRMNVGVDDTLGLQVYGAAHTFRRLCPVEEYFESHPNYFAQIDGERKRYRAGRRNQLCTSNPSTIGIVAQNAVKMLTKKPELDVITLFPNDGGGFCECGNCTALDNSTKISVEDLNSRWSELGAERHGVLSRRMAKFYIEVARRILSKYPDKYVQVGAYSAYRASPQNLDIRGPENTTVLITRTDCHGLPIECGNCNIPYSKAIDGWKKIFPLFSIYEYYWKHAANELPYPITHSIKRDIPFYHKKGCFGLYTQYSPRNAGTLLLNYYVAAKLLWNVNADVDEILQDFYHKFYGPAWKPMKAYHETLETAVKHSRVHLPAQYHELPLIFTRQVLEDCGSNISRAQEAVKGNVRIERRVAMARTSLTYTKLAMGYVHHLINASEKVTSSHHELQKARELARHALDYIQTYRASSCFNIPITPYVKRFFDPDYAMRSIASHRSKNPKAERGRF